MLEGGVGRERGRGNGDLKFFLPVPIIPGLYMCPFLGDELLLIVLFPFNK